MSKINLRPMLKEDLDQVARIEKAVFSTPWSVQSFEQSLCRKDTVYVVAENNGKILGYCGLYMVQDEADITNVAVRQDCRMAGIASGMLSYILDIASDKGVRIVTLEVRKSNEPAIRLYEKTGFRIAGERKDFYRLPAEDAWIMLKDLSR